MDATLSRISKRLGSRSVMKGAPSASPPVIPTGWWVLDYGLLQIGGLPSGRIVELAGQEGSGKSLTLYRIMAQAQKMGRGVALFDLEKVLIDEHGRSWVSAQGVDLANMAYFNGVTAEDILYATDELAKSGEFGVVGIDSIAAMTPRSWVEGLAKGARREEKGEEGEEGAEETLVKGRAQKPKDYGHEARVSGDKALLWSMTMSRILDSAAQGQCLIVLINQLRDRISDQTFWSSNDGDLLEGKSTGGWALRHYPAIRLLFEKVKLLKEERKVVGLKSRVLVVKSKVSQPFRRTGIDTADHLHIYSDGRPQSGNRETELFEAAVDRGLISGKGAWFEFGEEKVQGRENMIHRMRELNLFDALEEALKSVVQLEADWE